MKTKKLKGYLPLFRRETLLLKNSKFTLSTFAAHIVLVLSADWDSKHNNFGCVASNQELEELTGIDQSTWSRYKNKFLKMGHLLLTPDGELKIPYYSKYVIQVADKLAKYDIADLQEEAAIMQKHIAGLQEQIAILQNSSPKADYGVSSENADKASQSINSNANMQTTLSPKETIKNNKENIEKRNDASHQDSSRRISIQNLVKGYYPDPITDPDGCCIGCGKTGISTSAQEYWKTTLGVITCFQCGTPIRKEAKRLGLI